MFEKDKNKDRKKVNKSKYFEGIKLGLPVILGFIPVGIAFAIMARQSGFTRTETIEMSVMVFAGASQMMAVEMYNQGAGLLTIWIATFLLNLRHLIMSTCVVNQMKGGSVQGKLLAAFGVTDESFAIFSTQERGKNSIWNFLGLITVTYTSWVIGTIIGAVSSDFLPQIVTASLAVSLYAMFIGILIPSVKDNQKLILLVVITAATNTLLREIMGGSWALIVSTVFCAGIGVFFVDLDKRLEKDREDDIEKELDKEEVIIES